MSLREGLTPDELEAWEKWVEFQRETNIREMERSAMVVSIYPSGRGSRDMNIDYAVQLGAAILLEKPILLLVPPGVTVPAKLRQIADEVVEVDYDALDTASDDVREKIAAFVSTHFLDAKPGDVTE